MGSFFFFQLINIMSTEEKKTEEVIAPVEEKKTEEVNAPVEEKNGELPVFDSWADQEDSEETPTDNNELDVGTTVCINGEDVEPKEAFDELGIENPLFVKAILTKGYRKASAIQGASIPLMLPGKEGNILAQAPSGSGKTLAIALGLLSNVTVGQGIQAVCICHTRELAIQTFKYVTRIAELTEIKTCIAIPEYTEGEAKAEPELEGFLLKNEEKMRFEVLIGTPGTLKNKKVCDWKGLKVNILILDEADELVGAGNLKKQAIGVKKLAKAKRIFFFSATFEPRVQKFVEEFMGGPPQFTITRKGDEYHVENLLQFYVQSQNDDEKLNILKVIYENLNEGQSLLFCATKDECDRVAHVLTSEFDLDVGKLHGGLTKEGRDQILNDFRRGKVMHLANTNVLARGINIPQISLVINFTLPRKPDNSTEVDASTYTHRVGRCTRWDHKGIVVNIISSEEVPDLKKLKKAEDSGVTHEIKELQVSDLPGLEDRLREFRSESSADKYELDKVNKVNMSPPQ